MTEHIETEIKLLVPDLEAVAQRLADLGAHLHSPRIYEYNVRYDRRDDSLRHAGIVLRLRRDTRDRLTYKDGGVSQDGIISRTEIELEVSDFDAMEQVLLRLGFVRALVYEKYRTTYRLDDAEITLDEMPYGHFVEIEGQPEIIARLIDRLGLADAPRMHTSYVGLFFGLRQRLALDFTDIVFANFEGIDVPAELLITSGENRYE